jgi:hypothetical protein
VRTVPSPGMDEESRRGIRDFGALGIKRVLADDGK